MEKLDYSWNFIQTHLEVAAQVKYFSPQNWILLQGFVLLFSLVVGLLQSLGQLIIKPASAQKHTQTDKKQYDCCEKGIITVVNINPFQHLRDFKKH